MSDDDKLRREQLQIDMEHIFIQGLKQALKIFIAGAVISGAVMLVTGQTFFIGMVGFFTLGAIITPLVIAIRGQRLRAMTRRAGRGRSARR